MYRPVRERLQIVWLIQNLLKTRTSCNVVQSICDTINASKECLIIDVFDLLLTFKLLKRVRGLTFGGLTHWLLLAQDSTLEIWVHLRNSC